MAALLQALIVALWVYVLVLIARFVIDWVQLLAREYRPHGFALLVFEAVYTVTDPPLRALRRVIPPLRIGPVAIDMAMLILFFGIQLVLIPVLSALLVRVS